MGERVERDFALRFLALFSPFAFCIHLDYFLVGRRYFDLASNEAPHFWFGHALAWRDGGFLPLEMHMAHLPAIFYNEVGALVAWVAQATSDPFASMAALGLVLALLIAAAVSLWTTVLSGKFALSPLVLCAIASLIAVQPSLLLFPWSSYYVLGCLLLPLGFVIVLMLEGRDVNDPSVVAGPYVLGFAATVHFAALQVAAGLIVALLFVLITNPRIAWASWNQIRFVWVEKIVVACAILLFIFITVGEAVYVPSRSLLLSAATWAGAMAGALICAYLLSAPVALNVVRVLIGWLVGANVLYPIWRKYLDSSMASKGGLAHPDGNFTSALFSSKGLGLLAGTPWRLLFLGMAATTVFILLRSFFGRQDPKWRSLRPVVVFTIAVIAIVAASTRDAIYLPDPLVLRADRYLIAAVVVVPTVVIAVWMAWPRQIGRLSVAALGFAGLVYVHYTIVIGPTVAEARNIDRKLSPAVEHFLAQNPTGKVICYLTYVPHQCSAAFGYEWYRYLSKSAAADAEVDARRVYHVPMAGCENLQGCVGAVREPVPLLVIGRDVPRWLSSLGNVEFSYQSLIEPRSEGHHLMMIAVPASTTQSKY